VTAPLTDQRLTEIEARARLVYDAAEDPIQLAGYDVPDLLAEIRRLRALVNPATWTTPDGTVLDLDRQVFDRDGEAWTLSEVPPLTMAMVDGDLAERPLSLLFERRGPLTNEGEEL
jgi:hypothetical protein